MNLFLAKISQKIGFVTPILIHFKCFYRIKVSKKVRHLILEKSFTDEGLGGVAPTTVNLTEPVTLYKYTH